MMPAALPPSPAGAAPADPATDLLRHLLDRGVIHPDDWDALDPAARERFLAAADAEPLLEELVAAKLLTPYQAGRAAAGTADALVLGNYRLLARLGAGGAGAVFQAEHRL